MQDREALFNKISAERPDVSPDEINNWIFYLSQLKGCRLFSAVAQEIDEAQWLHARTAGIGGSDIASILGKNPWNSPRQVWRSKTGQFTSLGNKQSEAARWGNVLETTIATEWAHRNNRNWIHIPVTLQAEDYTWMLANIDGFTLSDDLQTITGILEIKTTNEYNKSAWEHGPIPYHYMCQTNWYCTITGLTNYTIVCLVGGQSLFFYEFPKDLELCAEMVEAAKRFWLDYVVPMKEPPAIAQDLEKLKDEIPIDEEAPAVVMEDDETERLAESYIAIREKISAMDNIKKAVYAQLFNTAGKYASVLTKTHTINLQQSARRSCDMGLLQEQFPEAYDACVKTTVSRSLRIK